MNKNIGEAFQIHQASYNATPLDNTRISNLIKSGKNNAWFNYFNSMQNNHLEWIDFEKEIIKVLTVFRKLFDVIEHDSVDYDFSSNPLHHHVLSMFDFFYDRKTFFPESKNIFSFSLQQAIFSRFLIEFPTGSGNFIISKERIVEELYSALRVFTGALVDYLYCFVDAPTRTSIINGARPICNQLNGLYSQNVEAVITFNYTNTFELLYGNIPTLSHIHGELSKNIVLGVNPDEFDNLGSIDTLFAEFKKYSQRIRFSTDDSYNHFVRKVSLLTDVNNFFIDLHIIGHSLDATDKDILERMFCVAENITIYYYRDDDVTSYKNNIVTMFGKNTLDKLRIDKELKFVPHPTIEWI